MKSTSSNSKGQRQHEARLSPAASTHRKTPSVNNVNPITPPLSTTPSMSSTAQFNSGNSGGNPTNPRKRLGTTKSNDGRIVAKYSEEDYETTPPAEDDLLDEESSTSPEAATDSLAAIQRTLTMSTRNNGARRSRRPPKVADIEPPQTEKVVPCPVPGCGMMCTRQSSLSVHLKFKHGIVQRKTGLRSPHKQLGRSKLSMLTEGSSDDGSSSVSNANIDDIQALEDGLENKMEDDVEDDDEYQNAEEVYERLAADEEDDELERSSSPEANYTTTSANTTSRPPYVPPASYNARDPSLQPSSSHSNSGVNATIGQQHVSPSSEQRYYGTTLAPPPNPKRMHLTSEGDRSSPYPSYEPDIMLSFSQDLLRSSHERLYPLGSSPMPELPPSNYGVQLEDTIGRGSPSLAALIGVGLRALSESPHPDPV